MSAPTSPISAARQGAATPPSTPLVHAPFPATPPSTPLVHAAFLATPLATPAGHAAPGSGVMGSGSSSLTTGSTIAHIELKRSRTNFGIGCFQKQVGSGDLEFVAKRHPLTSKFGNEELNLVKIAIDAVRGVRGEIENLPEYLHKGLDIYVTGVFAIPLGGDELDPISAETKKELEEVIQSYQKKTDTLINLSKALNAIKDDTLPICEQAKQILLNEIIFESEVVLGRVAELLKSARERIEGSIKTLDGQITEKQTLGLTVRVLSAKEIEAREAAAKKKAEAAARAAASGAGAGTVSAAPDKKGLPELRALKLLYEAGLARYEQARGGPISLPGPTVLPVALTNDHQYVSYRREVGEKGPVISISLVSGHRRPYTMVTGKLSKHQGDHVSAYSLVIQLLMQSIPQGIGRYEELPQKVKEMLSLAFPEAARENFLIKNESKCGSLLITDKDRRAFVEELKKKGQINDAQSKDLNTLLKAHQLERACEEICAIGDVFFATANSEVNASIPVLGSGYEAGDPEPLISRKKSGGSVNEGGAIESLEKILKFFAVKDLIKLVDGDISRSKSLTDSSTKTARIENFNKFKRHLEEKLSENGGVGQKKLKDTNGIKSLCGEIGTLLGQLIDLPAIPEAAAAKPDSNEMKFYKRFIQDSVKRHFRMSGVMIACALNGINNAAEAVGGDKINISEEIVNGVLRRIKQVKNSPVLILDELMSEEVARDGDDPDGEKVLFKKYLSEILEIRADEFKKKYLTLAPGDNAYGTPPDVPGQAGAGISSSPIRMTGLGLNNFSVFNIVTPKSNLTHQNVMALLRQTFVPTMSELKYDAAKNISVAVISEDSALDTSLRDTILSFLGADPAVDRASIALCRGHLGADGKITGNTHWTALHFRKVVDPHDSGKFIIKAYHADSMGATEIPAGVTRVLDSINRRDRLFDSFKGSEDLRINVSERLPYIRFDPCENVACARQEDHFSCGDRTVFNLFTMHQQDDLRDLNLADEVEVNEFIAQKRPLLQAQFSAGLTEARYLGAYDSARNVHEIIKSDQPTFGVKLALLKNIENELLREGASEALSLLNIEAAYKKIINEWVEEIRFFTYESGGDEIKTERMERFLNELSAPRYWQNPELVLPILNKISADVYDFIEHLKEEPDQLSEHYPLPDSSALVPEPRAKMLSELEKLPTGLEKSTFILVGPGMAKWARILRGALPKGSCTLIECTNNAQYEDEIKLIEEVDKTKGLHIIAFGHGLQRQIRFGKYVFPESIFEKFPDRTGLTAVSVASCQAGFESHEIKLGEAQVMILHAGKRPTISFADTRRVSEIANSGSFVPRLISQAAAGNFVLMPPETIKIVTQSGFAKISPFEAFKGGKKPDRKEILLEILSKQRQLNDFFGLEKTDSVEEKTPGSCDEAFFSMTGDTLEEAAQSEKMTKYLRELALLVVVTKKDERDEGTRSEKVEYLEHLLSLGVDFRSHYETPEGNLLLITEACAAGNIEMADLLITQDSNQLNVKTTSGLTPLLAACQKGQSAMVLYLLRKIEDNGLQGDIDANAAFVDACKGGCDAKVLESFIKMGANPNAIDVGENNCLHHAAIGGNLGAFRFLVVQVGDSFTEFANQENESARTPADEAAQEDNSEIVEFAKANKMNFDTETLREYEKKREEAASIAPPRPQVSSPQSSQAASGVVHGAGAPAGGGSPHYHTTSVRRP